MDIWKNFKRVKGIRGEEGMKENKEIIINELGEFIKGIIAIEHKYLDSESSKYFDEIKQLRHDFATTLLSKLQRLKYSMVKKIIGDIIGIAESNFYYNEINTVLKLIWEKSGEDIDKKISEILTLIPEEGEVIDKKDKSVVTDCRY